MSPARRPKPPKPIPLDLSIHASSGREFVPFLRRMVPQAHGLLDSGLAELSIALVGNAKMAAIHRDFLQIPGPTDVLTFPLELDARGHATAGEIVICIPYAAREARRHAVPVRHEVLLYAVHGLLHLMGYDDTTDIAFKAMHAREDQILEQLKLGRIFAQPPIARFRGGKGRRPA